MRRPPTERERLARRLNIAAYEALRAVGYPAEVRGFSRHPCPGTQSPIYPCHAPDAWDGSHGCSANHRYRHTNHPHDSDS